MKHLITTIFLLATCNLFAQNTDSVPADPIYSFVEFSPEWKEGKEAMYAYLSANINYPKEAMTHCISGKVYLQFIVEKDGSINEDVKVLRGIGYGCDEEALRVIKNMPAWNPGKQNGKPVRVYFNLPINFQIPDCIPATTKDK